MCTKCGNSLGAVAGAPGSKSKTTAGLLALFLGTFGVHKFYLGYNTAAIIYLAVSLGAGLITCGAATVVMSILALIEGIIYLTKSDEEFERVYVQGQKPWF